MQPACEEERKKEFAETGRRRVTGKRREGRPVTIPIQLLLLRSLPLRIHSVILSSAFSLRRSVGRRARVLRRVNGRRWTCPRRSGRTGSRRRMRARMAAAKTLRRFPASLRWWWDRARYGRPTNRHVVTNQHSGTVSQESNERLSTGSHFSRCDSVGVQLAGDKEEVVTDAVQHDTEHDHCAAGRHQTEQCVTDRPGKHARRATSI